MLAGRALLIALVASTLISGLATQTAEAQLYYCRWVWVGYWRYYCYYHWYWQQYYPETSNVDVAISVSGIPSTYSANVKIDGVSVGSVAGGSSQKFRVKFGDSHTFEVDTYVTGASGTRYYSASNTWRVESIRSEESYSFTYTPQHELSGSSPYTKIPTGWYAEGSKVNLEAPPMIGVTPGKRSVFLEWSIDGTAFKENMMTIDMNGPHRAVPKYRDEVLLVVTSSEGVVSGAGWHPVDSTVTVSVNPTSIPAAGPLGILGSRRVFERYEGDISSTSPIVSVLMNAPKTATVVWREDHTMGIITLLVIVVTIGGAVFFIFIKKKPNLRPKRTRKTS